MGRGKDGFDPRRSYVVDLRFLEDTDMNYLVRSDRERLRRVLHMNTRRFSGKPASEGTGYGMISAVRASSGKPLASASEVTDISEIRFRYRICPGVLPRRAPTGDAGGGQGADSTTSWPPIHRGAIRASSHEVAARESRRLGGRNPAARPARWLSRWQKRALRTRETAEGWGPAEVTVAVESPRGPGPVQGVTHR